MIFLGFFKSIFFVNLFIFSLFLNADIVVKDFTNKGIQEGIDYVSESGGGIVWLWKGLIS